MPGATRYPDRDRAVYQVSGRSFVFFRTPRPDAVDPETGERYDDVIVFWVESEEDKQALVLDESTPFFSTPHFDGHPSVLLRGSRIGELSLEELAEVVQDAWLARAGKRARAAWLAEHPPARSDGRRAAPRAPDGPPTGPGQRDTLDSRRSPSRRGSRPASRRRASSTTRCHPGGVRRVLAAAGLDQRRVLGHEPVGELLGVEAVVRIPGGPRSTSSQPGTQTESRQ